MSLLTPRNLLDGRFLILGIDLARLSFLRSLLARFISESSCYSRVFPTNVPNSVFFYSRSSVARSGDIDLGHARENKARLKCCLGELSSAIRGRSKRTRGGVLGVI